MLFVIGFMIIFVLGGLSGVTLAVDMYVGNATVMATGGHCSAPARPRRSQYANVDRAGCGMGSARCRPVDMAFAYPLQPRGTERTCPRYLACDVRGNVDVVLERAGLRPVRTSRIPRRSVLRVYHRRAHRSLRGAYRCVQNPHLLRVRRFSRLESR